jgi:hypothetical protein
MKANAEQSSIRFVLRGIGVAVLAATVVLLGARGAFLLNGNMMSPVALVGSWVMLTMVGAYLVARFRPALGMPVFAGVGAGVVVVAVFAGMGMMS